MEISSSYAPGRYQRTINRRLRRVEQNHFFKKLATGIQKTALKVGEKSAVNQAVKSGKVTEEEAKAAIAKAKNSDEGKKILEKNAKAGAATLAIAAALGAGALAAPALGAGGAAAGSGASGAGAGAVKAGGLAASGGGLLATNRKPTTPITEVKTPELPPIKIPEAQPTPFITKPRNTMSTDPIADVLKAVEENKTAQTIKNLAGYIPKEVKKDITNAAKNKLGIQTKKVGLDTVIANSRTSPELLPKNRSLKRLEDEASKNSDTNIINSKKDEGFKLSPLAIGGIILGVVMIIALVALRK